MKPNVNSSTKAGQLQSLTYRSRFPTCRENRAALRSAVAPLASDVFEQVNGGENFDSGHTVFGVKGGCWRSSIRRT
jgi:hypothetical protein